VDLRRIQEGIRSRVVGREEDTQLLLAALGTGRDLLLEGPPGTSKSTILRAFADLSNSTLHFVEGNADLTPSKLVGHHSSSRVLQEDYSLENLAHGPLPLAMAEGGILYIEEFNSVPEDTLNTLLTAMAARELTIPRVGNVRAEPGFRIVAAMNPFDNAGTAQLGGAITDWLEILGEMTDLCDRPDLRTLAWRLARELVLREARRSVAGRSGRGRLVSVPYYGHVPELDLDRSLECILSTPRLDDKDLYVLDRRHHRRAYTLILDTSGSMKGPALLETCVC
jgi:hypothetical protein